MKKFWEWIERIYWIAFIVSIIIAVISIVKGWWNMNDIILFWDNLTPGKFTLVLIAVLFLIGFIIEILEYRKAQKEKIDLLSKSKDFCGHFEQIKGSSGSKEFIQFLGEKETLERISNFHEYLSIFEAKNK